jgi:hypothetical protein
MKPPKDPPKYLAVMPSRLICDPDVQGPRFRKDVIEAPPGFERIDPRNGNLIGYNTDHAIRWISQFPSLQLKFAEIGYQRIDFLEASLWLDQSLSTATQNQFKLELMHLESDAFPIWQNAIRSTRQFAGKPINQTLREWMNEPIDLTEAAFFRPHWQNYPYACQAATDYLQHLSAHTQAVLQISLEDCVHIDFKQEFKLFKLNQAIKEVNKQARLLGLNFIFEEF